jgi:hypothetical protein
MKIENDIFSINDETSFTRMAIHIFHLQYENNAIYREFVDLSGIKPGSVETIDRIPFLPIEFFRTHPIISSEESPLLDFQSSGTTAMLRSHHYVVSPGLYERSLLTNFRLFYGDPEEYFFLALTPTPAESPHSSLVYMIKTLMDISGGSDHLFLLDHPERLREITEKLTSRTSRKLFLIGLTYALLDAAERDPFPFPGIIMETGGMKGRREEIIREELHKILQTAFRVPGIHSEYGMTELLSQAYSDGNGFFRCPVQMKILIRDQYDPKTFLGAGQTGGINIIDLANLYSCSFIATQDLGKMNEKGEFEVLGRFDNSELRGCSLML